MRRLSTNTDVRAIVTAAFILTGCIAGNDPTTNSHVAASEADSIVYLSDIAFTTIANGWGPVERDRAIGETGEGDGGAIVLHGVAYAKGLGAHAYSQINVDLAGQYERFSADVGVDDSAHGNGSIDFKVYADDELLYDSGTLNADSSTQTIDVSVAGKQRLVLIATDGGNGIEYDHADWADAKLVVSRMPNTDPTPTTSASLGGCGNCDGVGGVQSFESFIHRPVDYVLVWGWAQTTGDLMYAFHYLEDMWPASYTLHYDVPMILSGGTFAQVYNGSLDAVYLDVARTIASRDPNGIIRIGHEMNGNWYDWSIDSAAGSSAEFVLCYQHLVSLFRSVSPGFKFVWNPGAGKWAGIDFLPSYPGDAYVDFVSFDMYEDAGFASMSAEDRWNHFLENDGRGLNWLAEFTAQHGKPAAFDEWASAVDDGVFITKMHEWITTHNVAYQMYWHSDAAFAGSFATNPVNAATFRQLFGQ